MKRKDYKRNAGLNRIRGQPLSNDAAGAKVYAVKQYWSRDAAQPYDSCGILEWHAHGVALLVSASHNLGFSHGHNDGLVFMNARAPAFMCLHTSQYHCSNFCQLVRSPPALMLTYFFSLHAFQSL